VPVDRRTRPPATRRSAASTSWDPLAHWYNGWVGEGGSEHHRLVAIPTVMRLLELRPGEQVLDIGAGQGVLAPDIARAGGGYAGVDASPRLVDLARKHHASEGRFMVGDARKLATIAGLKAASSLQDMDPLEPVLESAAWGLRPGGRVVILLTHPSFRVPRQSGWGWDEGRKLVYRRVDRYLTPLPVPMKVMPGKDAKTTRSFHRPISEYVNGLSARGLLVDRMDEVPGHKSTAAVSNTRAENTARKEIPLFLGLRARKLLEPLDQDRS